MSLKDGLPEKLLPYILDVITVEKKEKCLLCEQDKSGELVKIKKDEELGYPYFNLTLPEYICSDCANIMKTKQPKKDLHEHELTPRYRDGPVCDICEEQHKLVLTFCCQKCNYDACYLCYYNIHSEPHPDFQEIVFEEDKMNLDEIINKFKDIPIIADFYEHKAKPHGREMFPEISKECKEKGYILLSADMDKNKTLSEKLNPKEDIPKPKTIKMHTKLGIHEAIIVNKNRHVHLFLNGKQEIKFPAFDWDNLDELFEKASKVKK